LENVTLASPKRAKIYTQIADIRTLNGEYFSAFRETPSHVDTFYQGMLDFSGSAPNILKQAQLGLR
jgi:hypothetical protein